MWLKVKVKSKFVPLHAMKVFGTVKELHSFLILAVDGGSSCSGNGDGRGNNKWGTTAAACIFCRFQLQVFDPTFPVCG